MLGAEIYKEILKEYENLVDNSKKLFEDKKKFLYKKCPRIEEIDLELSLTCIKLSKAIIGAMKEEKQSYIDEIKDVSLKLQEEKKRLMLENGFFESYFEDIYQCKKCKDTGFINNIQCECFTQKLINKAYNMSNLSELTKTDNFSTFNLDYYSKEEKENGISAYENISMILKKVPVFIEEFNEKFRNIIFYGPAGTGKTFICRCIAKELLDRCKTVVYVTAFELFDMIEKERFSKQEDNSRKEIIKFRNEADLLIIDDLGAEFITSLSTTELFNIINNRILNKKSTIISTNLAPEQLMAQYSSRVTSRFYGEYDLIKIFGEDIRIKKKFKN